MLFELFTRPQIYALTSLFGNILANISSDETGRKLIIQKDNFLQNILLFLFFQDKQRRVGALKTLRNVAFEYQDKKVGDFFTDKKVVLSYPERHRGRAEPVHPERPRALQAGQGPQRPGAGEEDPVLRKKGGLRLRHHQSGPRGRDPDGAHFIKALDILLVLTNIEKIEELIDYDMESLQHTVLLCKRYVNQDYHDRANVILCLLCKLNEF